MNTNKEPEVGEEGWSADVLPMRPDTEVCLDAVRQARLALVTAQRLVEVDTQLLGDSQKSLAEAKNALGIAINRLMISLQVEV